MTMDLINRKQELINTHCKFQPRKTISAILSSKFRGFSSLHNHSGFYILDHFKNEVFEVIWETSIDMGLDLDRKVLNITVDLVPLKLDQRIQQILKKEKTAQVITALRQYMRHFESEIMCTFIQDYFDHEIQARQER